MWRGKRFVGWCDMSEWIKCTENLPEQGVKCLVFDSETKYISINIIMEDGKWYVGYNITHWMPLPQPPKEKV